MTGAGGVLLNDEGTGADAADRELLMALDLDALDGHLGRPCGRRPLPQERDQLLDRRPGPLGMDEHGAVLRVPHPTHHPEPMRPPQHGVAVPDAVHLPAHDPTHGRRTGVRSLVHGPNYRCSGSGEEPKAQQRSVESDLTPMLR
jgi:hypothetical protein